MTFEARDLAPPNSHEKAVWRKRPAKSSPNQASPVRWRLILLVWRAPYSTRRAQGISPLRARQGSA